MSHIQASLTRVPQAGALFDGRRMNDVPVQKRGIGFVSYALFPYTTVRDNVAYGMRVRKKPRA